MKNLFKLIAILVIASLSLHAANTKDVQLKAEMMAAWKAQGATAQKVTKAITDQELIKWMKEDRDFVLVDVREPKEVAAGTILWMDFKAIPRGMVAPAVGKTLALKPNQTIVFYCKFGIRSALAAQELQQFYGFKNVYYLQGGITNWLKQGHEISNLLGELNS